MSRRLSNFQTFHTIKSEFVQKLRSKSLTLLSTISRVAVSAFLLTVLCHVAKADPVVPVGTVLGGTIVASSDPLHAITGTLQTLDQNGVPFVVGFSSQGGPLDFFGAPGTPVTFQAGIAGDADQGNAAINLMFIGTGPVIPNTNAATLDLIGTATITFTGFACTSNCLVDNPLFSFSGTFSGPVLLHFTAFDFNGETRYQLRTATFATPEPVSMLLLATGLAGSSIVIRRKYRQRR
jgi:PEP-CTERM motif-containing protein